MSHTIHIGIRLSEPANRPTEPWLSLAYVADQWFVTYLQFDPAIVPDVPAPWLFAGAHTLELYLKAACAKQDGIERAVKYGHRLFSLWARVAQMPDFPVEVSIKPRLNKGEILFGGITKPDPLSANDRTHLTKYIGLYRALAHVQHLKYLGVKGEATPVTQGYAFVAPDTHLIKSLQAIRTWLSVSSGHNHQIAELVDRNTNRGIPIAT